MHIRQHKKNKKGIANTYRSLSILFARQNKHETALDYDYKALTIEKQLNNFEGIAGNLVIIGQVYYNTSQLNKAKEQLKEATMWIDSANRIGILKNC